MTILGDKIRQHREWLDLTIASVAAKSGVSAPYISRIELGHARARNPCVITLSALGRALGLSSIALAKAAFEDLKEGGA